MNKIGDSGVQEISQREEFDVRRLLQAAREALRAGRVTAKDQAAVDHARRIVDAVISAQQSPAEHSSSDLSEQLRQAARGLTAVAESHVQDAMLAMMVAADSHR
jgi:hypothetical protein